MADKAFMSFTQNGETLAGGHSLLVGGSTMEYRALVNDVAKFIMENYDGSTLAGAAQTPKTVLDALNSKATLNSLERSVVSNIGSLLSTSIAPGLYYVTGATDLPAGVNGAGYLDVTCRKTSDTTIRMIRFQSYNSFDVWVNQLRNNSTWTGWSKEPTREDADALDAKAQQFSVAGNSNISLGLSDRFTIIAWTYATTSCGLDFIFVSSNTLRRIKMVSGANEPTYEIADGKIKVINSGSSYVRGMMIYGKIFN